MNKISDLLLKIANDLDDIGEYNKAEQIDQILYNLLKTSTEDHKAQVIPAKQPQIQKEPIVQDLTEKEAKKEFIKDQKKSKQNGIVKGQDYILNSKTDKEKSK